VVSIFLEPREYCKKMLRRNRTSCVYVVRRFSASICILECINLCAFSLAMCRWPRCAMRFTCFAIILGPSGEAHVHETHRSCALSHLATTSFGALVGVRLPFAVFSLLRPNKTSLIAPRHMPMCYWPGSLQNRFQAVPTILSRARQISLVFYFCFKTPAKSHVRDPSKAINP